MFNEVYLYVPIVCGGQGKDDFCDSCPDPTFSSFQSEAKQWMRVILLLWVWERRVMNETVFEENVGPND